MIKGLVKVTNSISVLTDLLLTCIYNHTASTCIVMNGILRQIFESFSKKKLNNFDTSLHRLRLEIMNGLTVNCWNILTNALFSPVILWLPTACFILALWPAWAVVTIWWHGVHKVLRLSISHCPPPAYTGNMWSTCQNYNHTNTVLNSAANHMRVN